MITVSGKTDIGRLKPNNEDSILIKNEQTGHLPNLFIVADGLGGHQAGDVASSEAIEAFLHSVQKSDAAETLDILVSASFFANDGVFKKSCSDSKLFGMGTTFTALSIDEGLAKLFASHIGDSRAYVFRDGASIQLTTDHTYVNEMIKAGQISAKEALSHPKRHVITRALGTMPTVMADGIIFDLEENDKVLLCSDGLTNMISDEKLSEIIQRDITLDETVNILVDTANLNGGRDNISAVLIKYAR